MSLRVGTIPINIPFIWSRVDLFWWDREEIKHGEGSYSCLTRRRSRLVTRGEEYDLTYVLCVRVYHLEHATAWFNLMRVGDFQRSDGGNWQIFPLRKDTTTSTSFHLGFGHAFLLLTTAMAATLLTMKQHRSRSIASPESRAECFNGCLCCRWTMGATLRTKSKEN
jgi:hypothetical protein